jgi:hypothetical protein
MCHEISLEDAKKRLRDTRPHEIPMTWSWDEGPGYKAWVVTCESGKIYSLCHEKGEKLISVYVFSRGEINDQFENMEGDEGNLQESPGSLPSRRSPRSPRRRLGSVRTPDLRV